MYSGTVFSKLGSLAGETATSVEIDTTTGTVTFSSTSLGTVVIPLASGSAESAGSFQGDPYVATYNALASTLALQDKANGNNYCDWVLTLVSVSG